MTSADHRPMVAPAASLQCFMAGVYLSHKTSRGSPLNEPKGAGFFYAYRVMALTIAQNQAVPITALMGVAIGKRNTPRSPQLRRGGFCSAARAPV